MHRHEDLLHHSRYRYYAAIL